jgi:hypothetical protein
MDQEFMHMRPSESDFSFDPVRGIITDIDDSESVDGDYLFYLHSDRGSGGSRLFELQIKMLITGRVSICTDDDRKRLIGGYPEC